MIANEPGESLIGVIIPSDTDPSYPDMADKIKRAAKADGLCALVCDAQNSARREAMCLQALFDANVTGIIAMPVSDDSHTVYAKSGIPVVLLGCRTEEEALGCVAMDDTQAGLIAAQRLADSGHRDFAFLCYPSRSCAVSDRLKGFSEGIGRTGAALRVAEVAGGRLEDSYRAVKELLECSEPPTAIAAGNDFTAIGAWQALREMKLPVGDGIALLGFGNTPFAALPKHGLSSVGPVGNMAATALELLKGMRGGRCGIASRVIMPPQLVCRSTFHD